MNTNINNIKNSNITKFLRYVLSSIAIAFILNLLVVTGTAYAANYPIEIKEINYNTSSITLKIHDASNQVYFSDSAQKNWEAIPGTADSANTITMDISWISQSSNYTLNFKGDRSPQISSVSIPKQVTDFKAEFSTAKGTVIFSNSNNRTIQWRKKDSTVWKTVNEATFQTELSYLFNNGATLVFRLAPVNGSGSSNAGLRPGKEVTVKIPKKADAPAITVDGSRFAISLKKGMAYRIVNSDGSTSEWVKLDSNKNLSLYTIASSAMYKNKNTEQKEVKLQFVANYTGTAYSSKVATVIVPIQEGPPDTEDSGISIEYVSSNKLSLQVKKATTATPFEYTIVDKDDSLSYETAKWSTISSNEAVYISKGSAKEGSQIYVRKKSVTAGEDTDFALASAATAVTGINGVTYPDKAKIDSLTTLLTIAGVCMEGKSSNYLTFSLYSPYSTTVKEISFYDSYGIRKGVVPCSSTVTKNQGSTGVNDAYIITTKITSTSSIDAYTGEKLYANITLSNSEVINSTSGSGVLLYIYPASKVKNPTDEGYTKDFKRIYMSQEPTDKASFKFNIDLGTEKLMKEGSIGEFTDTATRINSISYDRYTLTKDIDYTVEYGSYVNDKDVRIATATVTVNAAAFEKSTLISKDKSIPFDIKLNNNELLDDDIYMTLVSTATLDYAPIAWSISQGSLKETSSTTVTNQDGSTTTYVNELISYILTCSLFDKAYSVGVADVSWKGISILGSSTVKDGKATLNLSNAKLNRLTAEGSATDNIVISFSNGFVIDSGCKLTIISEP